MKTLLHLSDTHFGTERPAVVQALERLAREQAPDQLVVSGDITQRARPAEFKAAAAFIDRLGIASRLVIAGNHDIPLFDMATRVFAPYRRYRKSFGPMLEPVCNTPDLLVIGVRTTRRYRHIEGEVSAAQIAHVANLLQQADGNQLRIVVTHQPVHVVHEVDREHLLRGNREAVCRWADAGVDLVLGGHIHRPFVSALHEQRSDLSRTVWAVQAGTAVSSRIRHDSNNSINIIRYGFDDQPSRCIIERWDFSDATQAFSLKDRMDVQRSL